MLHDAADKAERAETEADELAEPLGLALLDREQLLERVDRRIVQRLIALHALGQQEIGVHAQEDAEDRLRGLKVAVRAEVGGQGGEDEGEAIDGDGSELVVKRGGRQGEELAEEVVVCVRSA